MPLSPLSYLLQCLSYCYELCPLELWARQYCFHKKKEIIFLNRETSVENDRFVLACESLNRVSPLPDSFVSTSSCNTAVSLGHEDFDLSDITLDGLFWWFCLIYALFPQWLCVESLLFLLLLLFLLAPAACAHCRTHDKTQTSLLIRDEKEAMGEGWLSISTDQRLGIRKASCLG